MSDPNNHMAYHIKQSLKTRWTLFKDWLEVVLGKRHKLTPPKRYDTINIGANENIANEFFRYFTELGRLKPDHKVLEVGSGFGRMAIPLTTYLNISGSYDGIEIIKDGYNWCHSHFTPRFKNFRFHRIDVYSERYNLQGNQKASAYEFPFPDETFDFVFLTSVFTHMYWQDIENYLGQISRVLKSGGKCLITWYLLNDESVQLTAENFGIYNFKFDVDHGKIENQSDPLYQIAFFEDEVDALYSKTGLIIKDKCHGIWCGRPDGLSFQDIIIAEKTRIRVI